MRWGSPPTRTWSSSGSARAASSAGTRRRGGSCSRSSRATATVSGHDGVAVEIGPGQAAVWEPNEPHETRSEHGLTALVVEGDLDIGGLAGAEAAVDAP